MAQTMESGFRTTLAAPLSAAATTMTVATAPTVTKGRLYLKSGSQEEWISYTGVSGTTITGLTRGLSQTADPATSGTGSSWIAGTPVVLVAMHDQISDKQEGLPVKVFADTTARDAAITSPSNGMSCYVTAEGTFTDYIAGSWVNRPTAAVSDGNNASTTVAGRVETATSAESQAGTDTGGTGALTFVSPSDIAANDQSGTFRFAKSTTGDDTYVISLTPALTAYTEGQLITFEADTQNTGACTINIDGLGAKSIKTLAGNDPEDGDIPADTPVAIIYDGTNFVLQNAGSASTTAKGLVERATDAEVTTATDTERYVTPDQLPKVAILQTTRATNAASGSVNIAHGLSRTPKYIEIYARTNADDGGLLSETNVSLGYSDGTNHKCTYTIENTNGVLQTLNDGSNCVNFKFADGSGNDSQTATASFDGTNVTLTWTLLQGFGGAGGSATGYMTILAHA